MLLTAMVVMLVGVLSAAPVWAHSRLLRTSPSDGAVLGAAPHEVVLRFNERVRATFTTVLVTGPGGGGYQQGQVRVVDNDVDQGLYRLPAGRYLVAWRAVSADGHPVDGQFTFTLRLPPGPQPPVRHATPARQAATFSGGGWWWGGGLAIVLAVAGTGTLLVRRRAGRP